MIIAHRGGRSDAPENSLAAVCRAWDLGVDAVEVDVQVTRDGRAAVFHDETTDRMTGVPGSVRERSMGELEALRLLHPETGTPGEWPVQPLEDFLPRTPSTGSFVIELKSAGALPQAVCSALEQSSVNEAQIILISFHLEALQLCKGMRPNLRALWLFSDWFEADRSVRQERLDRVQAEGLSGIDIKFNKGLTPEHLEDVKARRLTIFTYTVNEIEELKQAAELGLDGITTDLPERARDLYSAL